LAALARGRRLGPFNTVHYVMNHMIEPTADGAIGKAYLVEVNWDLPSPPQNAGGQNNTGRGWRIRTRTFIPSKLGPRGEWEYRGRP
jgi:hypothetical protein